MKHHKHHTSDDADPPEPLPDHVVETAHRVREYAQDALVIEDEKRLVEGMGPFADDCEVRISIEDMHP